MRTVQDVVEAVERLLQEANLMSGIRSLPMIKLLTGLLLLVWPFLIWLGLVHNSLHWLLPLMALLLLLRLRRPSPDGPLQVVTKIVAVVGIVLCLQFSVENVPVTAVFTR